MSTEDIRVTSIPRVDDNDKDPVGFADDSKADNVDDSMTLDDSPAVVVALPVIVLLKADWLENDDIVEGGTKVRIDNDVTVLNEDAEVLSLSTTVAGIGVDNTPNVSTELPRKFSPEDGWTGEIVDSKADVGEIEDSPEDCSINDVAVETIEEATDAKIAGDFMDIVFDSAAVILSIEDVGKYK